MKNGLVSGEYVFECRDENGNKIDKNLKFMINNKFPDDTVCIEFENKSVDKIFVTVNDLRIALKFIIGFFGDTEIK